jgi:hypothetical protein
MARVGRRTRLDDQTHETIVQLIRGGNTDEVAAAHAGISTATFYNWMARGRKWSAELDALEEDWEAPPAEVAQALADDADPPPPPDAHLDEDGNPLDPEGPTLEIPDHEVPFLEFFEAVTRARANAVVRHVTPITLAAQGAGDTPGDWRAAAWWLERRQYKDFGNRSRYELAGDPNAPLHTVNESNAADELLKRLMAIQNRREIAEGASPEDAAAALAAAADDEESGE